MTQTKDSFARSLILAGLFILFLWLIKLWEWLLGVQLSGLGVSPLEPAGLIGILLAPLVHGSAEHLAANSLGLLVLGTALIYGYPVTRWWVVVAIWLLSGLGVWLFGRPSVHFGASGLTHGLFFYLLTVSLLRRDKRSIALMMIAFFFFGSMVLTIFPREPGISYEYHLAGGVTGLCAALLLWRRDPMPIEKRYDWEDEVNEDDDEEDPVIGDLWRKSPGDNAGGKAGESNHAAPSPQEPVPGVSDAPRSGPPPRTPKEP